MKRATIFLNGTIWNYQDLPIDQIRKSSIICVDGGTRHALRLRLTPDTILGDLDSLPRTLQKRLKRIPEIVWIDHSPEKNQYETDGELALSYAAENNHADVSIFGFSGSRLDHMIANIGLFARFAQKNTHIRIYEKRQTLYFIKGRMGVSGKKNDTLSLIPLSDPVRGITTTGLRWNLSDAVLPYGSTLGISNHLIETSATITVKSGILLVIHGTYSHHISSAA